jgi:hypothetical protein
MNAKIEEFAGDYVVIPAFTDGGFGVRNVDKGDMTDKEWAVWNRIRTTPEIKEAIGRAPRTKDIVGRVIAALEEKGIQKCLINQERPIL